VEYFNSKIDAKDKPHKYLPIPGVQDFSRTAARGEKQLHCGRMPISLMFCIHSAIKYIIT
jgi:hypothetical protein